MRALIGVDGSAGAVEAVRQTAALLSTDGDSITLYFSPPEIRLPRHSVHVTDLADRARQALARSVFDEARVLLPERLRSRVQTVVGGGDPRDELPRLAEELGAELMAVGARGVGPIRALLIGSVSQSLARHAPQALLVARRKPDKTSGGGHRVLMPVDNLPAAQRVVELLHRLNWPADCSARLMHVVESLLGGELPNWLVEGTERARDEELARAYLAEIEQRKRDKFRELSEFRPQLPKPFAAEPPIVLEGYPAEQILATAAADNADLLIMASKESGGLARWVLGSTAERVLTHAPCSVLLVRLPEHG